MKKTIVAFDKTTFFFSKKKSWAALLTKKLQAQYTLEIKSNLQISQMFSKTNPIRRQTPFDLCHIVAKAIWF
jgi:hypothetical protein